MKFASRSAMLSASSASCGSRASRGVTVLMLVEWAGFAEEEEARKEVRLEGRRGVVGREIGERERVREGARGPGCDMVDAGVILVCDLGVVL